MFATKNLVCHINEVPVPWIFEHFCRLQEKLNGQDVKIKSLFNSKERTPSMCIYFNPQKQQYRFKDFSSGKGGTAVDLIKEIANVSFYGACDLIIEKYNDYILHNNGGYDIKEFKQASKYKVVSYDTRTWTEKDQYYWLQFNIGSRMLEEHCVKPLTRYTMVRDDKELNIYGHYLYGYFTKSGQLYKIYQPKTLEKKFIKVSDYVQGSEQLKGSSTLLITSSLKDLMSIKSLKIDMDIIAPDSENSMIRKDLMINYLQSYEKILVLFDNDEAGIKAMQRYHEQYPMITPVYLLDMSKDPSDSIKDHGAKAVREKLFSLLHNNL